MHGCDVLIKGASLALRAIGAHPSYCGTIWDMGESGAALLGHKTPGKQIATGSNHG